MFNFCNLALSKQLCSGLEHNISIYAQNPWWWYGHVSCLSGLAKTTLQGTVKGERRPDRQKKR